MGLDIGSADAILKEVYEGPLREEINQATRLLDFFKEGDITDKKWEGREVVIPLHKSRNSGVKFVSLDSGLLPNAGNQGTVDAKVPIKKIMGRIQLSADIMAQAQSNRGAFINALELEQKYLVKDVKRQWNRALAGFGQGTLAVISAGANSATQIVNNPGGVSGTVNPLRFLPVGAVLAFVDSTGAILRGVRTVQSQTSPNQVVLDSAVNTITGDLVLLGTTVGTGEGSFNLEPMGLLGLIDDTTFVGTLFGIDRTQAANAFYKSNVISNVGTLNPDILNRGIDNTNEVSDDVVKQWLAHYSIKREITKLIEADKRYNVNPGSGTKNFDAGSNFDEESFFYAGLPGKVDKDLPYGTLFGLSKGHLETYTLEEGHWADDDNTILLRLQNTDQYEARWRGRMNTFNDAPNAFVRFSGINATVTQDTFSL